MPEEQPQRPFITVEKIDMKIYGADKTDALWYKSWCDKQGITFAIGIKLMRVAVEKDTMYANIIMMLNDHADRINQLFNAVGDLNNKIEAEKNDVKTIKRFGTK